MSRLRDNKLVKQQLVHKVQCSVSPIYQTIRLNGRRIKFEIDSGASDTFCCEATWQTLGKPILQPVSVQYIKLLKVARYPLWDNSNQVQVLMENYLT